MDKQVLQELIREGLSSTKIAGRLQTSGTNVRYWLKKYDLKTSTKIGRYAENIYLCSDCGTSKKSDFANKGKERLCWSLCKKCHNKRTTARIRNNKLKAIEYKGGSCIHCGYKKCAGSLQFHHRDPKVKDPKFYSMKNWKFEKVMLELDKCDLVCGNCHGEIHWLINTGP